MSRIVRSAILLAVILAAPACYAATITTGGSGNWSSTTNNAPWPGGTLPVAGDVVEIAADHTVTLDQDTPSLGSAGIKNVAGSNTSVLSVSGTCTITGNVSHSGTATAGFVQVPTGQRVVILGQVTNTANGYAVATAGTATLTITNAGATAVSNSGTTGRGVSHGATGALNVTGNISQTGTGSAAVGVSVTAAATGTITGNINCAGSGNGLHVNGTGASVTATGALTDTSAGTSVYVQVGTLTIAGSWTLNAGEYSRIQAFSTLILGTVGSPFVLTNSGSISVLQTGPTTPTTTYCTINQQTSSAQAAGIHFILPVTGPTLPAVANVWTGSGQYGYAGGLLTPTKVASSIANCSAGNVASGITIDDVTGTFTHTADYTIISGVVAPAFVITGHDNYTGGSAGTYVAPVQAGYSALAAGYGAGGGTSGTLAGSKIRDATYGTLGDGSVLVAAGGTYVDPADSAVWHGTAVGVSPRAGTKVGSSIANLSAGNVASGVIIDDVTGTFTHTMDYTLISGVVGPTFVLTGHDNYTGGSAGSLTLPGAGYVLTAAWGGPAAYGVGGNGSTPTATLTAANTVWHSAAAFGAAGNSITPSKIGSSITNLSPGNVKLNVIIDDVKGTYGGGGGGSSIDPGVANVWYGVEYVINDVALVGTKRASSITNCMPANVKAGVTIDDVLGIHSAYRPRPRRQRRRPRSAISVAA